MDPRTVTRNPHRYWEGRVSHWKSKYDYIPDQEQDIVDTYWHINEATAIGGYNEGKWLNFKKYENIIKEWFPKHFKHEYGPRDYEKNYKEYHQKYPGYSDWMTFQALMDNKNISDMTKGMLIKQKKNFTKDQLRTIELLYDIGEQKQFSDDLFNLYSIPLGGSETEFYKKYRQTIPPKWADYFTLGKYMGPGNSIARGWAEDKIDEIAREHDIAYTLAKSNSDILKADKKMQNELRKVDPHGWAWVKKNVGHLGIGMKSWFEQKFGVMYPQGLPTSINTPESK